MGKTTKTKKIDIGIGHIIRGMQAAGFGHEEIQAMRYAMTWGRFDGINFCEDSFYQKPTMRYFEGKREYTRDELQDMISPETLAKYEAMVKETWETDPDMPVWFDSLCIQRA